MKLRIEHVDKIEGKINISGSKNAALPLMACSILTDEKIVLNNIPDISDIRDMSMILEKIGVNVTYHKEKSQMCLQKKELLINLNIEEMAKIRASYYLMGALVANKTDFLAYYPGGCNFSKRPIDYHIEAFKKIGYNISEKDNVLSFSYKMPKAKKIIIVIPKKSVGTTINILLASSKSMVTTIIKNASIEPEVLQVIKLLKKMGSRIIIKDNQIIIRERNKLHGTRFKIMADRIEAGSYMLLATAVDNAKVCLNNVDSENLKEVISVVKNMGVSVDVKKDKVKLLKNKKVYPVDVKIEPYPSFPTDLQPILSVVCTKACGISIIEDTIYPERISHIEEITKAGGSIKSINNKIIISTSTLKGNSFYAHDLRCGFACIILSLIATGESSIDGAEYIFRGYENLIDKLRHIGISIEKDLK